MTKGLSPTVDITPKYIATLNNADKAGRFADREVGRGVSLVASERDS